MLEGIFVPFYTMDTPSPRSLPELARSIRPWAFGAAIATALGFHFFLSHIPVGWPLALFALIVTGGIILITQEARGLRNRWALLFLIPLLSACVSTVLYSSDVVKGVSFFTIAGSLAALAYWLTAPTVRWRDGIHLWKTNVFLEAALPFRQYQMLFTEAGSPRRLNSKLLLQIGIGLLVAGPVLLIFLALFLEGDRYFSEVVSNWITLDFLTENVVRLFFDVLVALFAIGFFWGIARRSREEAQTKEAATPFQEIIATRSFLFAISALFVVFAGFQLFYLFQGSQYLLAQGRTYADYAVSGYQQLCFAAAFAFLILLVVYRLTRMDDRWVRWTSIVIAVTSAISTVSAGKRLWLYVDAYGLTLSRSWGMQFLVLVILLFVLLVTSLVKRWNIHQLITAGSTLTLGLLSITLLINHEGFVANYNLSRHAAQKGPELDLNYLVHGLSRDAVPAIAEALGRTDWNPARVNLPMPYLSDVWDATRQTWVPQKQLTSQSARERVYEYWRGSLLPELKKQDARQLTLSDLQAERIIEALEIAK